MSEEKIPIEYYLTKNGEVIKFVRYGELVKYKEVLDKIKEYGENCLENLKDQDDYIDESINVVALLRMIHKNYLELLEEIE